jgi:hypothetical protein
MSHTIFMNFVKILKLLQIFEVLVMEIRINHNICTQKL